jgi:hypothetical protein
VLEEISSIKFPAIVNGVVAIGAFDFTEENQNLDYQAVVSVEGDAIDSSQKFPVNFKATKKRQRLLFNSFSSSTANRSRRRIFPIRCAKRILCPLERVMQAILAAQEQPQGRDLRHGERQR